MAEAGSLQIDLLRHGEPEGGSLFRGSRDDPLSETGWRQMWQSVGELRPWDRIISSPLRRCSAFARRLSEQSGLPLVEESRLRELGFGQWEGCRPEQLYREQPQAVSRFWQDPVNYPPPDGEPMDRFQQRVLAAWNDLLTRYPGEHLLLVAHGGVNRVILGEILAMPLSHLFRIDIPFAGVSRIRIEQGVARLSFHGTRFPGDEQ